MQRTNASNYAKPSRQPQRMSERQRRELDRIQQAQEAAERLRYYNRGH